jgi:hypothetical protein
MPAFLKSIYVIILMNSAGLALTAGILTRYASNPLSQGFGKEM